MFCAIIWAEIHMYYITLDKESKTAYYVQLMNSIINAIDNGILRDRDKLPTEDEIIECLNVSRFVVRQAYENLLNRTSTPEAPWYVVPADRKWFARYLVSQVVLDTLEAINPQFPELSAQERATLAECRRILEEDA